jgi:nitroreductase
MAEMGLFEAMYTARALRRLKPDPVPDEIIAKVIDAGIRAASGRQQSKLDIRGD